MFRLLLKKALLESWLLLLACGVMVFVFCWTRVWIVTRFELHRFEPFLDQLKQFEQFMPVPLEQVLTYSGSLALTFDEPVLLLCMLVWAISRGSDVVSGELGRGTLEMLLAQPVGRIKLLLAHSLLSVAGVALLTFLVWLGLYAGIHTNSVRETIHTGASIQVPFLSFEIPIMAPHEETVFVPLSQRVDAKIFVSPCFNLFAFTLFMLGLSTLLSAVDRYRWRTIGVVVSFYVLELLILLLAKATPTMAWCHAFTFFTLYQPDGIVHLMSRDPEVAWSLTAQHSKFWYTDLGPLGISLGLIAMACAFFVAAGWYFQRRDLPAPV